MAFFKFLGTEDFQWTGSLLSLWWKKHLFSFLFPTILVSRNFDGLMSIVKFMFGW